MQKKHLIVIIDDSWPDEALSDVGIIDYKSIKRFCETDVAWSELTLKHFIKSLIKRSTLIEDVEVIGFHRIEHYLTSLDKGEIEVPNVLVIDWDFGVVGDDCHKASEHLPKVIAKKGHLENIYIFSRSDNMEDISKCLILPEMIIPGLNIFLYDKQKKENEHGATLQKLIDRALRKVENIEGKTFKYNNLTLTFYSSVYLNHYLDFWKVDSIVGSDLLTETLTKNNNTVNKDFIEKLFELVPFKFQIDLNQKHLLVNSSKKFVSQLGILEEISALDALKNYGLNKLEKVIEKSIIQL